MDLCYNPTELEVFETSLNPDDRAMNKAVQLKQLYPGTVFLKTPNMPRPLYKSVQFNAFVDIDHTGDKLTR